MVSAIQPYQPATAAIKPRSIFEMSQQDLDRMKLLAEMYSASTFSEKSKLNKGDYFLMMIKGCEVGLNPMASIDLMDVIQGLPTLKPQGMLAMIYQSGQLEDITIDSTDERCIVTMKRRDKSPITVQFTMEDANRIKTTEWSNNQKRTISLSEKYNWQQMPGVMLKWRAIAKAARDVFPDIIQGMYLNEEIDPDVEIEREAQTIEFPAKAEKADANNPVDNPAPATDGSSALDPAAVADDEIELQRDGSPSPFNRNGEGSSVLSADPKDKRNEPDTATESDDSDSAEGK